MWGRGAGALGAATAPTTGLVLTITFLVSDALAVVTVMPMVARDLGGLRLYRALRRWARNLLVAERHQSAGTAGDRLCYRICAVCRLPPGPPLCAWIPRRSSAASEMVLGTDAVHSAPRPFGSHKPTLRRVLVLAGGLSSVFASPSWDSWPPLAWRGSDFRAATLACRISVKSAGASWRRGGQGQPGGRYRWPRPWPGPRPRGPRGRCRGTGRPRSPRSSCR